MRSSARTRYVSYFLRYPEQPPGSQESQFATGFAHIQRAFQWALQQHKERIPHFWQIVKNLLMNYGYWQTFIEWGTAVQKVLNQLELTQDEAWLISDLGWLAMEQTRYAEAEKLFEESADMFYMLQDNWGICALERYLGVLAYRQQLLDKAETHFQTATKSAKKHNFSTVLPELENLQGSLARKRGDFVKAKIHYMAARLAHEASGNEWSLSIILRNIAKMELQRKEFESAQRVFSEAIELSQRIGRKDALYGCLLGMAETQIALGNMMLAKKLTSEARQGFTDLGMRRDLDRAQTVMEKLYTTNILSAPVKA